MALFPLASSNRPALYVPSGYLDGYSQSNQGSNHFAKISAAYCARMRTALIKRFEAAERSDRRLRGAAAYFSCNTEDLHVK